jgi:hypothetical protein
MIYIFLIEKNLQWISNKNIFKIIDFYSIKFKFSFIRIFFANIFQNIYIYDLFIYIYQYLSVFYFFEKNQNISEEILLDIFLKNNIFH